MNRVRSFAARLLIFALPVYVGCQQSASAPPVATTAGTQPMASDAADSPAATKPAKNVAPPDRAAPVKDITFDTIKLAMNKEDKFQRSLITPGIEKLDGTPVRIHGWIHPNSVFQQTGITQFVLVRDNQECCFGPGAAIFDCIMVEMTPGHTADFTTRPISVEGKFSIQEVMSPWGALVAIYHLDGDDAR